MDEFNSSCAGSPQSPSGFAPFQEPRHGEAAAYQLSVSEDDPDEETLPTADDEETLRTAGNEEERGTSENAARRKPVVTFDDDFPITCNSDPLGAGVLVSSPDNAEEEFVKVNLADIRKDVQCPICLGIIRKTRTVMECLHRFCRECIDKSMRLGNNECPVCRTHCASRRSLRDDLNFDALIAALYQNIDKYEETEFSFCEENELKNKQLQESIADTLERQSDAVTKKYAGKVTDSAVVRKVSNKFQNVEIQSKSRTQVEDVDHELFMETVGEVVATETNTRERRSKRRKREITTFQLEATDDEQVDNRPLRKATKESKKDALNGNVGRLDGFSTWSRAGSRSTARNGNLSMKKNRLIARAAMLLDVLSAATQIEKEIELNVHFTLQPFNHNDGNDKLPSLEKPHLCCAANVTVQHVCELLSSRLPIDPQDELELLIGKNDGHDRVRAPEILHPQVTLGHIHDILWHYHGNLVIMYRRRG